MSHVLISNRSATRSTRRSQATSLSRRIRAILAGGIVLGVGVGVTLASWNDSEFAQGSFSASGFSVEGSLDGTSFTSHSVSADAAILAFTVPATSLAPNDVIYAPYALRLDSASSSDGTVTVTSASTKGSVTGLTYSLVKTSTFGCNATSAAGGTVVVPAATAVGVVPSSTTFAITHGSGVAGPRINLCFVVTAGPSLVQLQTGTSTMEFTAVSS